MKFIKPFIGIALILLSYSSNIHGQDSPSQKMIGFNLGIDYFFQLNTSRYQTLPDTAGLMQSGFSNRTRKIIPAIGFGYFYTKKENRIRWVGLNLSAGVGKNEVSDYRNYGGNYVLTNTSEKYQPLDNLIGTSKFEPFSYFNIEAGYAMLRSKTFDNKLSFLFGMEGLLGYTSHNYSIFRITSQATQDVKFNAANSVLGFRLMMSYPLSETVTFIASTRLVEMSFALELSEYGNDYKSGIFHSDLASGIYNSSIGLYKNF